MVEKELTFDRRSQSSGKLGYLHDSISLAAQREESRVVSPDF